MKKCAVIQSSYIPWRGFFDFINSVDEFILYDDVQYTKRDWRSRNQIKTANGLKWLSIPIQVKGKYKQLIKDAEVSNKDWARAHWQIIEHSYRRAPYFDEVGKEIAKLYKQAGELERLSEINYLFIENICKKLGIKTKLSWSMDYEVSSTEKNQRLIDLCKAVNASFYLSGPAAKTYIDEKVFQMNGILVRFMDYSGYPIYTQQYSGFEPAVSILDLLFNVGFSEAPNYMNSFMKNDIEIKEN